MLMETVVSGIRPTGKLHLGNYFGAYKNFLTLQESHRCYFFIADYHSLTTHPNPADLRKNALHVLAEYIALGLDPEKCAIYLQSDLPETSELYLFMAMNAYKGELERVTSFKDKIKDNPNNINAGLLTYPVLMAADILIHHGTKVPVGKDQEQHLEMARTFGNRFNRIYDTDYFAEPTAFNFNNTLVKVPGLSGTGKMSKSAGEADCIYLCDDAKTLEKKIKRAKTDAGPSAPHSEMSPEIKNLFDLMALVSTNETCSFFEEEHAKASIRYGDFKGQLAKDMEAFIAPKREAILGLVGDTKKLNSIAQLGKEKAHASGAKTLKEVRKIIGFGS